MASLTRDEAITRAGLLEVTSMEVALDLTTGAEHFGSVTTIRFGCREPGSATFVELNPVSLAAIRLNGRDLDPGQLDDRRFPLTDLAADNVLVVEATMAYSRDGQGLHRSVDPADERAYVYGHLFLDAAPSVFACFDQPDLKAPYAVTVTAPEDWVVIGNGAETREGAVWTLASTKPLATYFVTVCAGPYVVERDDHDGIPLAIYGRASLEPQVREQAAQMFEVTKASFDYYHGLFGIRYPFGKYDQVFVPEFNAGAMENPGCVTFRDTYLFRGAYTREQLTARSNTIAHEMAHMWFGDLVTMRWWEDSWLNESFADFMGYEVAGRAAGFDQSWVTAAVVRKPTAYQADRRRSTHPVAEDAEKMPDADTAFANFDMITYAKGNALVRQLAIWLGEDDFLRGVNGYLSSHPFGNASLADFLDALAAASERDVRGWAEAFLRTTGYDTLRLTRDGDVPVLTREGSRPHRLSITTYDEQMHVVGSQLVDLGDEPLRLPEAAGLAVVPNSGDETYARVVLDDLTWARVREQMSAVEDPVTRALLWWTAVDGCEGGEVSLVELVELAARHLPNEEHPVVFEGALRLVQRTIVRQSSPEVAQEAMAALAGLAETVLRRDDVRRAAASRVLASCSTDGDQLRAWLDHADLPAPDQDVRWLVVRRLAALGDDTHLANERSADRSVSGELGARAASAATPTAEAKAAAWASLVSGDLSNREFEAVAAGFWQWDQTDLVRPYLDRHAPDLLELGARSGQAMGDIIGAAFPWLPLTPHDRSVVRSGLEQALAGDVPTVLRRTWDDLLDDLDRVIQGSPTESLR